MRLLSVRFDLGPSKSWGSTPSEVARPIANAIGGWRVRGSDPAGAWVPGGSIAITPSTLGQGHRRLLWDQAIRGEAPARRRSQGEHRLVRLPETPKEQGWSFLP